MRNCDSFRAGGVLPQLSTQLFDDGFILLHYCAQNSENFLKECTAACFAITAAAVCGAVATGRVEPDVMLASLAGSAVAACHATLTMSILARYVLAA
jgi:hypothetical protein